MSITVKWGRERITLPLPSPDTTLQHIRNAVADYTQLPEHSFKLIHSGAVMKDSNAPISSYSIRANSVIALIGGVSSEPPSSSSSRTNAALRHTEQSTISQIRFEVDIVRNKLTPLTDLFLQTICELPQSPQQTSSLRRTPGDLEKEHARLAELLLQSLLRLDSITTEGSWDKARAERKVAVQEVQLLLDRLDGGWKARVP